MTNLSHINAVCHNCGTHYLREEPVECMLTDEDEISRWYVPLEPFICPGCEAQFDMVRIWKSLDITDEIKQVATHENR